MLKDIYTLDLTSYYNVLDYTKDNFTCQDRTPFTYLLHWTQTNMFYYGVRWKFECLPSELMVTYHTSSNHVKKYIKEYGQPDIVIIDKIFYSTENATEYEHLFLLFQNASKHENFLNKHNGGDTFKSPNKGKSFINRPKTLCEHCNKEFDNGNYKKYHGDKCTILTGIKREQYPKVTEVAKAKRIETLNKKPIKTCPHCNIAFSIISYTRFHGDSCRVKTGISMISDSTRQRISNTLKNKPKVSCK